MKVLITGGAGQLGFAMSETLATIQVQATVTDRRTLDITQESSVRETLSRVRPDWVINCAAYTNVEAAEDETELAYLVNERAVGFLADAALEVGAKVLHISTDFVFSGEFGGRKPRPYTEDDDTQPVNVYGASKRAGEALLLKHEVPALILRSSWVHGGRERNFLATMLRLGEERRQTGETLRIVADQHGTPTDCWSLAAQIRRLVESDSDVDGILHASCQGETTWFGFAAEIFRQLGWSVPLERISSAEFPTRARRPAYSVLENRRLAEIGFDVMPRWEDGLAEALRRFSR